MHAASIILLCWAVIGAAFFSPAALAFVAPVLLGLLVALVGLPHGAADHRFARRYLEEPLGSAWLPLFLAGYVGVAAAVFGGWMLAPAITIVLFFLASAWHFGQEEPHFAVGPRGLRPLFWIARGGLIIWVPLVCRPEEVTAILLASTPPGADAQVRLAVEAATAISCFMLPLAAAALGLQSLAAFASAGIKRRVLRTDALMTVSLVALMAVVSPVVSFLVYFCGWHSARGLRRLRRELGESWPQLAASLAPMTVAAVALIVGTAGFVQLGTTTRELLIGTTFVGLSAIATPHLVLHSLAPLLTRPSQTKPLGVAAAG
ncbi:MAG: Brp/Blh family beta-carotene 15,15'-dioxygenase [Planctomycetota bacterium]